MLAAAIRHVYAGRKYITPSLAEDMALDLAEGRGVAAHEALFEQIGLGAKSVRT